MSKRYLKIRGVSGVLVADPFAIHAEPRRYAGQRAKVDPPKDCNHADRFDPCEQVIQDHINLRRAAKNGEIEILSIGVGESIDAVKWKGHETWA